jgi:hypothetical protein
MVLPKLVHEISLMLHERNFLHEFLKSDILD